MEQQRPWSKGLNSSISPPNMCSLDATGLAPDVLVVLLGGGAFFGAVKVVDLACAKGGGCFADTSGAVTLAVPFGLPRRLAKGSPPAGMSARRMPVAKWSTGRWSMEKDMALRNAIRFLDHFILPESNLSPTSPSLRSD